MRQKPTVLASEIVASSRLFRVEQLQLRFANGVERILKEHVPGVTRVEQVNASGETDDLYDEYAPF